MKEWRLVTLNLQWHLSEKRWYAWTPVGGWVPACNKKREGEETQCRRLAEHYGGCLRRAAPGRVSP